MTSTTKNPCGPLERLMLQLDDRVSIKLLMRVWGPRVELAVRVLLVATFLDDSLRTVTQFGGHVRQIGLLLSGTNSNSDEGSQALVVNVMAGLILVVGLAIQSIGSASVVALFHTNVALNALMVWTVLQPVLYMQLSNYVVMSESLSLLGGLLLLRTHLNSSTAQNNENNNDDDSRTQLLGRMLLPAAYLYHAGVALSSAWTMDENEDTAQFVSSLSVFVVHAVIMLGLVLGSLLVAGGLKSRFIATVVAVANTVFVLYQHPFFAYAWYSGGKWHYAEHMRIPSVALPDDVTLGQLEEAQIYDLHRYYFFLGLSTTGALLLLAQYGPGEIAIQKDEMLLPMVQRAQD